MSERRCVQCGARPRGNRFSCIECGAAIVEVATPDDAAHAPEPSFAPRTGAAWASSSPASWAPSQAPSAPDSGQPQWAPPAAHERSSDAGPPAPAATAWAPPAPADRSLEPIPAPPTSAPSGPPTLPPVGPPPMAPLPAAPPGADLPAEIRGRNQRALVVATLMRLLVVGVLVVGAVLAWNAWQSPKASVPKDLKAWSHGAGTVQTVNGFSARMPDGAHTLVGQVRRGSRTFSADGLSATAGPTTIQVLVATLPQGSGPLTPEQAQSVAADVATSLGLGAFDASIHERTFHGLPATDLTLRSPTAEVSERIYVQGRRLVVLAAAGPKQTAGARDALGDAVG